MNETLRAVSFIASLATICACSAAPSLPSHAGAEASDVRSLPIHAVATAPVGVNFGQLGPAVADDARGASFPTWTSIDSPGTANAYANIRLRLLRWPGGSESDIYHWANGGSLCSNQGGYIAAGSTFDNVVTHVAQPAGMDVAVTLNYGSNPACNGGGDPAEAASWVAYAKSKGYARVRYWTVGNEVYGSWEFDLHAKAHDPATYASAVKAGYYPQIKAANPSAQVGVVVEDNPAWDSIVLKNAKYDFVEFHYYAQAPGSESDSYLLQTAPSTFAQALKNLRAEMQADGVPASVPIYVGELNSVYSNPGKQTVSIVNGLFAGMAVAEMMKQAIPMATWWIGFGGCDTGNNNSASLYGWQDFGTYTLFSDGIPTPYECPGISETIAFGTPFPDARAYQLIAEFAPGGSRTAATSVPSQDTTLRGYAAKTAFGYSLLLFNLGQTGAIPVSVSLAGTSRTSFSAELLQYGKAQYDRSKSGVWWTALTQSLGTIRFPYALSLPPYSMTVITLK